MCVFNLLGGGGLVIIFIILAEIFRSRKLIHSRIAVSVFVTTNGLKHCPVSPRQGYALDFFLDPMF